VRRRNPPRGDRRLVCENLAMSNDLQLHWFVEESEVVASFLATIESLHLELPAASTEGRERLGESVEAWIERVLPGSAMRVGDRETITILHGNDVWFSLRARTAAFRARSQATAVGDPPLELFLPRRAFEPETVKTYKTTEPREALRALADRIAIGRLVDLAERCFGGQLGHVEYATLGWEGTRNWAEPWKCSLLVHPKPARFLVDLAFFVAERIEPTSIVERDERAVVRGGFGKDTNAAAARVDRAATAHPEAAEELAAVKRLLALEDDEARDALHAVLGPAPADGGEEEIARAMGKWPGAEGDLLFEHEVQFGGWDRDTSNLPARSFATECGGFGVATVPGYDLRGFYASLAALLLGDSYPRER
jgi:hypothetical protein